MKINTASKFSTPEDKSMTRLNRRQFFKVSGIAGGGLVLGLGMGSHKQARAQELEGGPAELSPYVQIQTNGRINIFSKNKVTKYKLLCIFNEFLDNNYKKIKPVNSGNPINMTLATNHKRYIFKIWKSSGYKSHPTIDYLIKELI